MGANQAIRQPKCCTGESHITTKLTHPAPMNIDLQTETQSRGCVQRLVLWITRGFPMHRGKYLFYDRVMNRSVHQYRCNRNKLWMATGRWDVMRVALNWSA